MYLKYFFLLLFFPSVLSAEKDVRSKILFDGNRSIGIGFKKMRIEEIK